MRMFTFHLYNRQGGSSAFEAHMLADDAAAFAKAGEILVDHYSCDHIDVREADRPVVSRHREQPIMRPVCDASERALVR